VTGVDDATLLTAPLLDKLLEELLIDELLLEALVDEVLMIATEKLLQVNGLE
jgi:hypothetical protein